jgi:hypothetical protein
VKAVKAEDVMDESLCSLWCENKFK